MDDLKTVIRFGRRPDTDVALLGLRLFIGGFMLLRNIGKMQDFDQAVAAAPELPGVSRTTVFTAIAIGETVLSLLLMCGIRVRSAAVAAAAGSLAALCRTPVSEGGEWFLCTGIYLFLAVAGGGRYAFLRPEPAGRKPADRTYRTKNRQSRVS